MRILGLNAYHGDSSAAVLEGGQLTAAAEEERYNRMKHWAGLPVLAARACLGGSLPDHVAISRDPKAKAAEKFLRVLSRPGDWGRLRSRAANTAAVWNVEDALRDAGLSGPGTRVHHVEHHRAHLASAFFCSPFSDAAVVSVDGFGDYSSVMWGTGGGARLDVRGSVSFPHSLGLFYTAFTQLLGFPKYGDEYKMMGLAAYGEPRFAAAVRQVVRAEGTEIRLNLDYFRHHTEGVAMTWDGGEPELGPVYSAKLEAEFGPARVYRSALEQRHRDMAASVQVVLEEVYFALLEAVRKETGRSAVCLAGGVALNCAANGKLFQRTGFRDVFIQPAAHDAGTAAGAALFVQHQVLGMERCYEMREVYSGPEAYSAEEIAAELDGLGLLAQKFDETELVDTVAAAIASGAITGWFQGRMEFGPRALGNRSILADPRRADVKETLNLRIKYREPFRPFCPSIPREAAAEWFTIDYESPYMVMAYPIREEKRALIPGVVHADGTGRLQTVTEESNPLYWRLLRRFGEQTGVPILINTSFNENEPIVRTPREAIECFLRTEMDLLVLGPYVLRKENNRHVSAAARAPVSAGSDFEA